MATVLFITPQDLKSNTILNGNIDTDAFISFVKIAQQMHVQNYLGTKLYNSITEKIVSNTLTGDYLNLVIDFVQPALIHFAMVDYIPFSNYQIRNGGVFKHKSENSESVTMQELDVLIQKHRTFAEFYAQRFVDYMAINASTKFPEYYTNTTPDLYPDQKPKSINWVI